jgi:hypothetical protein
MNNSCAAQFIMVRGSAVPARAIAIRKCENKENEVMSLTRNEYKLIYIGAL